MKKYILFYLLFCLSVGGWAKDFVHPGILHSSEALRRIAGLVKNDVNPSMGSFNKLKAEPEASYHYCIQGPFRFISRSGEYGYTKSPCEDDFNAAYYNAIMWNITKDRRHADKAMEIIRNYAATLEKIFPMDAPLCAGLQGFILVNAAEIMRYTYVEEHNENGWTYKDTEQTEDMFRNVFLPILSEFYKTKPYTNGNWGIAVTKAQIGISVFLNDTKLYDDALDFFYHGKDNGTLPNYVAETGQIQESGRDQAHCMLGIGCLAEIAEVAWNQGDDLYGALDNRIMKGCEYLSKSNLGYDVPFHVWKDLTGKYSNWQSLGQASMGEFRAVFELPYNHYVERKKMEMPYTKMVLNRIRPEGAGFTCDNPGFGTLLFYLGKDEERERKGRINENLKENLFGWHFAAASLKLKGDKMMLMSSGISCKKKGIMYDGKYSINSLVYWVTYVHNVVYSFYRSMIYCYINSTQRCAGSIVIDIIPTNGADKRKFFPFAPYFPVTNVIKRYFYPYFPAIIGIKGYSFPYFPYLSGIMKIKTALYSLFSRLDWHKTVVFPCLGEIYEGIRSLSWEIPVT